MTVPVADPMVPDEVTFDLVRRGYDCRQVDDRVAVLHARLAEVRVAHRREQRRADRVEREHRNLRARVEQRIVPTPGSDEPSAGDDFRYRADRLMRVAVQQADETRAAATAEAAALLEGARADADAYRHQIRESLATRIAVLEQVASRRAGDLDERERRLARAVEELEQTLVGARARSDRLRRDAHEQARRDRDTAARAIRDRQLAAQRELSRLRQLGDEERARLGRLLESVQTGCGGPRTTDLIERA